MWFVYIGIPNGIKYSMMMHYEERGIENIVLCTAAKDLNVLLRVSI